MSSESQQGTGRPRWGRLLRWLGPALGLAMLVLVGWLLQKGLGEHSWADVWQAFRDTSPLRIALAWLLTLAGYLLLGLFDLAALHRVGRSLAWRWAGLISFLGYALGFNLGLSALSGGAVRYRLYSRHGLKAGEISRIVMNIVTTMWLGFCVVAGITLLLVPFPIPPQLDLARWTLRLTGTVLLLIPAAYLLLASLREESVRIGRWRIAPPRPAYAWLQLGLGSAHWLLVPCILYILLPGEADVGYGETVGIYALASVAGVLFHVPGGLGVIESVFLYSLENRAPAPSILGSVLVFRCLYYLLPLALAGVVFGLYELAAQTGALARPREEDEGKGS